MMEKMNTRRIATAGVLLALSVATLFAASVVPGIELTLYSLSTVYVAIMVIEFTPNTGWLFYFASVMLTWVLLPNKAALVPYTIFFGMYSLIKYYIEYYLKKVPQVVQIILKLVYCNTIFALGISFFGIVFLGALHLPDLALPILLAGAQVFFLLYDYILTLLIGFYLKRRPKA